MSVTPGLKDILHHIQFCTILGMIAVLWPKFACRSRSQAAHNNELTLRPDSRAGRMGRLGVE
jgi:hypothetical protein